VTEAPNDMFGKVMSISDELIITYFTLMTRVPLDVVAAYEKELAAGANPRDYKMKLGFELVRFYHSEADAEAAQQHFIDTFANKQTPTNIPELTPTAYDITTVLKEAGFAQSSSEVRRAVDGGGVKVNDEKVTSHDQAVQAGDVVQKGKRFFVKIM